jgi:hypothetical protein
VHQGLAQVAQVDRASYGLDGCHCYPFPTTAPIMIAACLRSPGARIVAATISSSVVTGRCRTA